MTQYLKLEKILWFHNYLFELILMDLVKISFEDMLDHGDWSNQRKKILLLTEHVHLKMHQSNNEIHKKLEFIKKRWNQESTALKRGNTSTQYQTCPYFKNIKNCKQFLMISKVPKIYSNHSRSKQCKKKKDHNILTTKCIINIVSNTWNVNNCISKSNSSEKKSSIELI